MTHPRASIVTLSLTRCDCYRRFLPLHMRTWRRVHNYRTPFPVCFVFQRHFEPAEKQPAPTAAFTSTSMTLKTKRCILMPPRGGKLWRKAATFGDNLPPRQSFLDNVLTNWANVFLMKWATFGSLESPYGGWINRLKIGTFATNAACTHRICWPDVSGIVMACSCVRVLENVYVAFCLLLSVWKQDSDWQVDYRGRIDICKSFSLIRIDFASVCLISTLVSKTGYMLSIYYFFHEEYHLLYPQWR